MASALLAHRLSPLISKHYSSRLSLNNPAIVGLGAPLYYGVFRYASQISGKGYGGDGFSEPPPPPILGKTSGSSGKGGNESSKKSQGRKKPLSRKSSPEELTDSEQAEYGKNMSALNSLYRQSKPPDEAPRALSSDQLVWGRNQHNQFFAEQVLGQKSELDKKKFHTGRHVLKKGKKKDERFEQEKEKETHREENKQHKREKGKDRSYIFVASSGGAGVLALLWLYQNLCQGLQRYLEPQRRVPAIGRGFEVTPLNKTNMSPTKTPGSVPPGDLGWESLQGKRFKAQKFNQKTEPVVSATYGSGEESVFTNQGVKTSRSERDDSLILSLLGIKRSKELDTACAGDLIIDREAQKCECELSFESQIREINESQFQKENAERDSGLHQRPVNRRVHY